MVDKLRIDELMDSLNSELGEVTPYKLALVNPSDVLPVDENAHFMPKAVYDQLRRNVEHDRNLSSLPFCWRTEGGSFQSLSGNHRLAVAREAGIESVLILYTDERLGEPERVAIQLSHNSLVGDDNPAILRNLWLKIDNLGMKSYAGLDDGMLATVEPIQVNRIDEEKLRIFDELTITFLPCEIGRIKGVIERLGKSQKERLAARIEDFDRFFEVLLTYKESSHIINTATAFLSIIEIVEEWLGRNVGEQ